MTIVTWRIRGQKTERKTTVPDGESYHDWIGQQWDVDPNIVEVMGVQPVTSQEA